MKRADVVHDVEELLAAGESPERIPQRMGMTIAAVQRALYRAAQPDLARQFNAPYRATRGGYDNHTWSSKRAEMQRRRRAGAA